jgi:hypothetical protein
MDWYIFGSISGVNTLLKKLYNFVARARETLICLALGGGWRIFQRPNRAIMPRLRPMRRFDRPGGYLSIRRKELKGRRRNSPGDAKRWRKRGGN